MASRLAGPILVAPDSFKGTYSASEVAAAIADGIKEFGGRVEPCPVADGGEGTLDCLLGALGGSRESQIVCGPQGDPVEGEIGFVDDGRTAIVELAQASGLTLVPPAARDAETATSTGTGELILAALEAGAKRIVVAAGGSASTDGGAGAIAAIGDPAKLIGVKLEVLSDVDVPFEKAAEVFAPQKGAKPEAVERLNARLTALAEDFRRSYGRDPRGRPMTGAAGGFSGGLWAAFGADIRPGAAAVLEVLDFKSKLRSKVGVVVGEGSLDSQSFQGKIVGEILAMSGRLPVFAVAGRVQLTPDSLASHGLRGALIAGDLAEMREAGRRIAGMLAA